MLFVASAQGWNSTVRLRGRFGVAELVLDVCCRFLGTMRAYLIEEGI
jgi:hypothetical protein